jgi:thiamine-monophosphate kinase
MSDADSQASPVDEFDLIARLMRPLTDGAPEALDLLDDVAVLPAFAGEDLVVSADMIVEGVHFLASDPLDLVARKLLRVNLSDLAAKGAQPYAYFLTVAWPPRCGWPEREAFAAGLRQDQDAYGLKLLGGDTVSTPGPLTASATILGRVPSGRTVLRSGAKAGDVVLVSGQIGDGWLGLQAALGQSGPGDTAAILSRYRTPEPRTVLTELVQQWAHAAADVSDGLLADAARIAIASGLAIDLDLERAPLSAVGEAFVARGAERSAALLTLATGGDDYELVLTCAPEDAGSLIDGASKMNLRLTVIGRVVEGQGVRVRYEGEQIRVSSLGYRHS